MISFIIQEKVWDKLRWELKTSELLALAKLMKVDVGDILRDAQQKHKVAKRIFDVIQPYLKGEKYVKSQGA